MRKGAPSEFVRAKVVRVNRSKGFAVAKFDGQRYRLVAERARFVVRKEGQPMRFGRLRDQATQFWWVGQKVLIKPGPVNRKVGCMALVWGFIPRKPKPRTKPLSKRRRDGHVRHRKSGWHKVG